MRTKPELRKALAEIIELAKCHRDFSDGREHERWNKILDVACGALEDPSFADIERYLRGDLVH